MQALLNVYKEEFERYLAQKYEYFKDSQEPLADAVRYALSGAGKRIRPILAYLAAEFMGHNRSEVNDIALGVECIHNYSLVHDDLPCMDDDTMRHGKPATHVVYGYGMGVLAGDALLNVAFEFMLGSGNYNENYIKGVSQVAKYAGLHGMIGGQCIDIKDTSKRTKTLEEVIKLNELKTACLFKAALIGSATACGATAEEIDDLIAYANRLGLVFQIVDDILDFTASEEELGKNVMSDLKSEKLTYIDIVGVEEAKKDIERYVSQAEEILSKYGQRADKLIKLNRYLANRTR